MLIKLAFYDIIYIYIKYKSKQFFLLIIPSFLTIKKKISAIDADVYKKLLVDVYEHVFIAFINHSNLK